MVRELLQLVPISTSPLAVKSPINSCVSVTASPNTFDPVVMIVEAVIKDAVKNDVIIWVANIVPLALISPEAVILATVKLPLELILQLAVTVLFIVRESLQSVPIITSPNKSKLPSVIFIVDWVIFWTKFSYS